MGVSDFHFYCFPHMLVGHNLFLDLLFTIDSFLQKVPETYEEFMDICHKYFRFVTDTKYLTEFCSGPHNKVRHHLVLTDVFCVYEIVFFSQQGWVSYIYSYFQNQENPLVLGKHHFRDRRLIYQSELRRRV